MFQHPPEWWIALVNLTNWFDWEAIGAVGTVGALWYAVVQGFKSTRFERLRAASELTAVLELVGPVVEASSHDEHGRLCADLAGSTMRDGTLRRAIDGLKSVSLANVPDTDAISYLAVLRSELPALFDSLTSIDGVTLMPRFNDHAREIAEAHDYMRLLKIMYLTGSLTARRSLRKFVR